jgi:hopanoid biosynthesis associated RND transporter like protein HpnN
MNPVRPVLQKILLVQTRHPLFTLFAALGLAALSIFYTARNLDFQTGQKDLISSQNRLMKLSRQIDAFDKLDTFVVVIESPDHGRSLKFLHALVSLLKADRANYAQLFYRVDPEIFKPWALLYLNRKELLTLRDNLQEHRVFVNELSRSPDLTHFFSAVNHEMTSAMVGELFTGFLSEDSAEGEKKPLDLHFLIRVLSEMRDRLAGDASFTSPWESFFTKKSWGSGSEEGYFWTKNKRYLLAFVTPRKTEKSFSDALHSLKALRKTIAGLKTGFPEVKVGVTGQEALNEDEMGVAFHDMSLATLLSLLGLAVLLVVFWRGFRRPLLELIELLVALSWTFGLTTLFIGHLNILSVTFTPLLLGLGIDYGIHWFSRYQEELQRRAVPKEEALQTTMLKLGPSIVLAGFTAALSFFPLVLTGFKGLVELGIITSMGMAMTTVTTLCLLPSLILLFDKSRYGPRPSLSPAPVKTLLKFNRRRALAVLIPAGLALALCVWGSSGVAFDLNMLHLQSKRAESVVWEKKLLEGSERSSMYGAILARSLEEVRQKTAALEALPTVSKVQSIRSLLPDDQVAKIQFLRQMKALIAGLGPFSDPDGSIHLSGLDNVLGRIRFKMSDASQSDWGASKPLESQMVRVRELIDEVRRYFHGTDSASSVQKLEGFEKDLMGDLKDKMDILRSNVDNTTPMGLKDLPKVLLQRYVGEDHRYLIRVFPAVDIWEPQFLGTFVQGLRSVDPEAIGDPVTLYTFTKAFRDASIKAAIYAFIFICAVLLLTFRNILTALVVMTPLVMGTAWTVGLMHLFDIDFNLANSIFLPLIVGAGVEYGIIIVQRWRQLGGAGMGDVVLPLSTAKGVILAGLTTTVGFGSLTISNHQGIYSLGLLAMVGSLSILTAAILFLPALLQVLLRVLKRRESSG